ncbi:MAG TPA: hypothetical protein PK623_14990, partial [Microthrixaceae bacterium]|nr:hypothetical protein [Microthrixaceae bacterium]
MLEPTGPLDPTRDRLDAQMEILRWRTVAGLVIGAAIMVLPMFGAHRLQIGAVILSAATVSNMALFRRARRGGSVPSAVAIADL